MSNIQSNSFDEITSTEYVLVENDVIVDVLDELPGNWKNFSNFRAFQATDQQLEYLGWYRPRLVTVEYDSQTHYVSDYTYSFNGQKVFKNPVISKIITPEELFASQKAQFLTDLRSKRNQLLSESDWTCTVDLQEIKDTEWRTAWKTYRQQLRDLPAQYENNLIVDTGQIQWPVKPGEAYA